MNYKDPPFLLEETNYKLTKDTDYEVAVLPWGATEAHNYHLPYGTDTIQVEHVARQAGETAWSNGAKVVILPCIPLGINTGQLDVTLCMNILPTTQLAILKDICDVLSRQEIDKLVILNGHGGNNFKNMIRELSFFFPDLFCCWVDWFRAADWNLHFDEPGDHAGEMETSAVMHIAPDLVRPLSEAGPGHARKFKLKAFKEGWVNAQRQWTQVTADTGVGNPAKATPEKGKKYMDACAANLADFFTELARTPRTDLYE